MIGPNIYNNHDVIRGGVFGEVIISGAGVFESLDRDIPHSRLQSLSGTKHCDASVAG